jgi:hypothetical protein
VVAAPAPASPAPAPAEAPAAEPQPEQPAAAVAPAPAKPAWNKWLLYGGLALGNLLILGLGYFAFRMIMGGGKSPALQEGEEDEAEGAGKTGGKGRAAGKAPIPSLDDLDLPDDAIDIEPADDKLKKKKK